MKPGKAETDDREQRSQLGGADDNSLQKGHICWKLFAETFSSGAVP